MLTGHAEIVRSVALLYATLARAMEPQPLWNGSLPVCLVEYHQGLSRRLRLVLTWQSYLTKGEKELLDHQRPVHGRIHSSGLLFGYAADRCTEPDWYVLPDGHLPDAWKLIHAARKGGDRFCVGREARYMPSGKLMTLPTKPRTIALSPSTRSTFMTRGDGQLS